MVVGKAIAFTGEIDPLGMAEFVANEAQIRFAGKCEGEQPDHLMQGDSALDHEAGAALAHVPVHLCIHHQKGLSFVTDERLIVAFHIADALLAGALILQLLVNRTQVPVFVGSLFKQLDPEVRHTHRQPVIEAEAPFSDGTGQPRHP